MRRIWAMVFGGLIPVLMLSGCTLWATDEEEEGLLLEAEIATVGIDYLSESPVVLLRTVEGGRAVPIWIGLPEAQAIARALHGIEMPRPLTHDLAINLLTEGRMTIEEVVVHDMRDGIFYGKLLVRKNGAEELTEVDSRPSDALALALRANAVIRVSEALLEDAPDYQFVPPDVSEQVVQVMGMTVVTLTEETRDRFQLDEQAGVVVSAVTGVAEKQGLQAGDVIIRVNDRHAETPMDVLEEILDTAPGSETEFRLHRNGEEETIRLPVEEGDETPVGDPDEPKVTI